MKNIRSELKKLGIKVYRKGCDNDQGYVRKTDVVAFLAKANPEDEERKLEGSSKLMDLLDELGVSRSPAYTGWGVEVYEDKESKIQVVANFRNDTVLINRGW